MYVQWVLRLWTKYYDAIKCVVQLSGAAGATPSTKMAVDELPGSSGSPIDVSERRIRGAPPTTVPTFIPPRPLPLVPKQKGVLPQPSKNAGYAGYDGLEFRMFCSCSFKVPNAWTPNW